jgi:hypothetical protein
MEQIPLKDVLSVGFDKASAVSRHSQWMAIQKRGILLSEISLLVSFCQK